MTDMPSKYTYTRSTFVCRVQCAVRDDECKYTKKKLKINFSVQFHIHLHWHEWAELTMHYCYWNAWVTRKTTYIDFFANGFCLPTPHTNDGAQQCTHITQCSSWRIFFSFSLVFRHIKQWTRNMWVWATWTIAPQRTHSVICRLLNTFSRIQSIAHNSKHQYFPFSALEPCVCVCSMQTSHTQLKV